MFTNFDYSVEKARREEVRREVETNRLVGGLRASLRERNGFIRFVRKPWAKEPGPESARV